MRIKKAAGKVYGAAMTVAEKKSYEPRNSEATRRVR